MAIQPQQPRQQRRGDSGGGTACTRRSAPLIYSILFCPSLFFLFIPTHTHTHTDILYIEAKTKNKAGVFFSPSLPPYSFSLLTSTSSLILLYLIIFFPSPRPIFSSPCFFPPHPFFLTSHFHFLPLTSFLISTFPFLSPHSAPSSSSLSPFLPYLLISFPHPYLPSLIPSSPSLHPHCVSFLLLPYLHISSMFHPLIVSSLPILFFSFPSLPPYFFLSPFLSLPPPFLPHILHSCRLIFFSSFVFFPSCLLVYFPPHIFLPYLFLPCLSTSSFHYFLILHSSSSSLPPSLLVSSSFFTSCCLHQNVCF